MIVGLRNEIGQENMHTFPGVRPGISSLRSRLIADPLVDPYVSYLNNTRNLTDQHVLYDRFTVGPLSSPESFQPPLTWGVSLGAKF